MDLCLAEVMVMMMMMTEENVLVKLVKILNNVSHPLAVVGWIDRCVRKHGVFSWRRIRSLGQYVLRRYDLLWNEKEQS